MNYNQLTFWLLFASVYLLYWRLDHRRQNTLLLVASYVFYGFWDYRFLFLILVSTVIDFIGGLGVAGIALPPRRLARLALVLGGGALLLCSNIGYGAIGQALAHGHGIPAEALPHHLRDFRVPLLTLLGIGAYALLLPRLHALEAGKRRKAFLVISMVANLGILAFFKYCDFFLGSFHNLLTALGFAGAKSPVLGIILPAGISFYTFQAMSYTIDIYRGEVEPTDDLGDFALFVCFFPHLVAGPIMRAHTLLPQVLRPRQRPSSSVMEEGLILVVIGLFKKITLSDNVAPIADAVFTRLARGDTASLSGLDVLIGVYAFALQIYGDFSGYSSIARGISKWLGFELAVNFHLPYLAVSPSDFWRRWHISLSSWLRDYLYIPLGGNRGGVRREYRNLVITMLLGGLWHGASWTFVAWGLYHGVILCAFRLLGIRDVARAEAPLRWTLRVVVMFHLTCLGWLLFRAEGFATVTRALSLIFTSFHPTRAALVPLFVIAFYGGLISIVEGFLDGEGRLHRLIRAPWPVQGAFYAYVAAMIVLFQSAHAYEFIYFQF
ncbi:Putative poly(beta-D-mannuronate) O-acetylase [Minicystis rosea]|nr:Putative poly(beta-D-mannuronate) O-acetylase [Minicystis rosea]